MHFFLTLSDTVQIMFVWAWFLFAHGGWAVFVLLGIYLMYRLYMIEIWNKFIDSHDWVFLHIKVEKTNLQSSLAVEQIFNQLHAMHTNFTWPEKYFEGKVNMWLSLEIVSLGGKISYIIKTPKKYLGLVESAFYAQHPNAEITEVHDYMGSLKQWHHQESSWDLWGTEYKMVNDYAFPIKTYRDFEHPTAEEKIIDPLAGMLEALSKCDPHELMAVQIIIRPVGDPDWTGHAKEVIKKTRKQYTENEEVEEDEAGGVRKFLTEGERKILFAAETKISKPAWETKIRNIYIAPKDKFDPSKKAALIGGFRQMSGVSTNSLKPDIKGTWTNYNYHFSAHLEKPFVDWMVKRKKYRLLKGFIGRSAWIGAKAMIMNCEELATIFHFPLATTTVPPVERIEVKKGQPPADLPIL